MSIDNFVTARERELVKLLKLREEASGSIRRGYTRKIDDLEDAIKKATRKGIQ